MLTGYFEGALPLALFGLFGALSDMADMEFFENKIDMIR